METFTLESTIALNNGINIPRFGLGVWQAKDGEEVKQAILWAIEAGYRLIDTAKVYGNENGVGEAIAGSPVPREQLFITTKLWNLDQGYDTALNAIDASLERLGLTYVDLYLVHWPSKDGATRKDSWRAMEEILKRGKAKAIGVSNYTIEDLEEMKTYATVMPSVNQIELHPFWYQKELAEYCQQNNIVVEAYSPLARAERLSDPRILAIATKYGKSAAQVLIRWSLQHGWVVIPKSVHRERIVENKDVFDFELKEEDMEALDALNENQSVL
jgi:methylglyoxal/glyoxal reductase